jgi:Rrf2 family protein
MKFSTRTSYGLRALICLAQAEGSLSVASMAGQEKISAKYLEAIFADFKKAKLVTSSQGLKGGYRLIKKPSVLSILEIVRALEKTDEMFYCISAGGKKFCAASCQCGVKRVVDDLNGAVSKTLSKIMLKDLYKKDITKNIVKNHKSQITSSK